MLNAPDTTWQALYEGEDLGRAAHMVATCVAAMEFEVRLDGTVVHVSTDDWPHLVELLDEIIDEQEQFDAFIGRWQSNAGRTERRLLITMIIIVASLAVAGAIKL